MGSVGWSSGKTQGPGRPAAHPPRGSLRSPMGLFGAPHLPGGPGRLGSSRAKASSCFGNSRCSVSLAQFGHVLSLNQSLVSEGCSTLIGQTRGARSSLEPTLRCPWRASAGQSPWGRPRLQAAEAPGPVPVGPWRRCGQSAGVGAPAPRCRGPSIHHMALSEGLSPALGQSAKRRFSERIRDEGPRASGPRTRVQDRSGARAGYTGLQAPGHRCGFCKKKQKAGFL